MTSSKTKATIAVVQAFIDRDQHLWRMNQVKDEVKKDHSIEVNDVPISRVLRGRFGMRYKRVQLVAFQGNAERCLVLR